MSQVRDVVRLHPNILGHKMSKSKSRAGRRNTKVSTTKVNKHVWQKALELSGNNPKRLEILSETSVRIRNQ